MIGHWFPAVASFLAVLLLVPQTQRVVVRLAPSPNQTLRLRTSEDVSMTSEHDPAESGAPIPPENVHLTFATDMTFTVGSPDTDGRYEARVVCDTVATTATLNGQP